MSATENSAAESAAEPTLPSSASSSSLADMESPRAVTRESDGKGNPTLREKLFGRSRKTKRKLALSSRLSLFVAAIVTVALVGMALTAGLVMHSWMQHEADHEIRSNLNRVVELVEQGANGDLLTVTTSDSSAQWDSLESADWPDGERGRWAEGRPPGLDGPGSNNGQLQVVQRAGESAANATAGFVDHFHIKTLTSAEVETLLAIEERKGPQSVPVGSLGTFRVMKTMTSAGDTVIVGQSTEQIDGLTRMLWLVEGGLTLVIVIAAAWIGRVWVKREMKPLASVAQMARHISDRDLVAAEVEPLQRFDGASTHQGTEVGDVGRALNAMIDNVESALSARAESEQRLRQFVADASHELRTPLAAIQGYTQLLQKNSIDSETALARIASESHRMGGLVEDLLLLARLDAGRELAAAPVDVVPLIVDAVMDAHVAGPDHDWQLVVPEGDAAQECTILGDEAALRQVIANLVNNARLHTPAGTQVRVGVELVEPSVEDVLHQVDVSPEDAKHSIAGGDDAQDSSLVHEAEEETDKGDSVVQYRSGCGPKGSVRIIVADNGQGVPAHLRPTIFDRFVRADTSRTRSDGKGSSGLGLAIVLSIAEAMGGRVDMVARCDGEEVPVPAGLIGQTGTSFQIVLPRY